jgi:hypothetical protein
LEEKKMSERKTIYKLIFVWNFEKEEQWLNEMAMEGWALVNVGFCRYTFEKSEPGEYTVGLEMHSAGDSYIDFMKETGAEYIGRVFHWIYFRKKVEDGQFDIFSDIDSKIKHLDKIGKLLASVGFLNLFIGVINSFNPTHVGVINLLCATVLMYGLGRIHGKRNH